MNNYTVESINVAPINDLRYRKLPTSIRMKMKTFIGMIGIVDINPPHQRLDINKPKKKQDILKCVLEGEWISSPCICDKKDTSRYRFEVADGSHRFRTIIDFVNGKIPLVQNLVINGHHVGGMRYSALPDELKETFDDYPLSLEIFSSLTSTEIGDLFRNVNSTTPQKEQEMLNSYGQNLVACAVRNTARGVDPEVKPGRYELFRHVEGNPETSVYFNSKFTRLSQDQMAARMLYSIIQNNGPVTCRDEDVKNFYIEYGDNEKGFWTTNPHVRAGNMKTFMHMLDFVLDFTTERKKQRKGKMTQGEYVIIYRYYLQIAKSFGHNNFKVRDWNKFVKGFLGDGKHGYDSLTREPSETSYAGDVSWNSSRDESRAKAFRKFVGTFDNQSDMKLSMEWLNHVIPSPEKLGIVELDKKRSLSPKKIGEVYADAHGISAVTGKYVSPEDAVGAHIIAYSKGGKTIKENIAITESDVNRDSGTISPKDYKKLLATKENRP